jgi:hypothetical protein
VNLEESSSNTHGGLGILKIPSSIVNSFFLSILSLCLVAISVLIHKSTVTLHDVLVMKKIKNLFTHYNWPNIYDLTSFRYCGP